MPQYDYNFDPHAALPENLILGEEHKITKAGKTRVIVPKFAPFFFKDFILRRGSEVLVEGVDYYLCITYREATHRFGQLVYGGIWLIDDNRTGTFRVDYRTVGAQYVQKQAVIDKYLKDELTDPQMADWVDLMGTSLFIPPVEIKFDRPAFIDEQALSAGIRTLGDVIAAKDPKEDELYLFLDAWLLELERVVHSSNMIPHLTNYSNPHETRWFHADALKVDGVAVDAAKAYGKTLAQLTTYVNERGITQAHLDAYIKLRGNNLVTGNLLLRDGAMLIEGVGTGTDFMLSHEFGNATTDALKGISITSDSALAGGKKSTLEAGTNKLEVVSSGGVQDKNGLRLNGQPVVHKGNLTDHLPTAGEYVVNLRTQNTINLTFTGKGTTSSPLKVAAVIPDASVSDIGLGKITDAVSTSTTLAISEYAVGVVGKDLNNKVPKTRKINGKELKRNVIVTVSDIELGNVSNLPDSELPITSKHLTLIDGLAPVEHEHSFADFNVPNATESVWGLATIAASLTPPSRTSVAPVALVHDLFFRAESAMASITDRVPKDLLDLSMYGGYGTTPIAVNILGWKITFTQTQPYYTDTVQYTLPITVLDLAVLFPTTRYNTRIYIYVGVENGKASYILRTDLTVDTSSILLIGYAVTSSSKIEEIHVDRKFRMGRFREMVEHIDESNAHGFNLDDITADSVGLGIVENKPTLENLVIPSFKDVFNTWYRFSHRSDGVYPSIPAETETWQYLPDTDSIRNLTNSSSFIGLVSNDVVGDYEFEVAVSSTNADDDFIGIVLGFVIKDGVEYTLTALACGTDTRDYSFSVVYNYIQSKHGSRRLWHHNQPLRKGWDDLGECVIRAVKSGNKIDVTFSNFSGQSTSVGASTTINLTGDLAIFRGSTRFGYAAQSQPHSTWRSIKRPDEDASSYYGSAKLLAKNTSWSELITYRSGKVVLTAGKGSIPLPSNVDPNSYHVWLGTKKVSNDAQGLKDGAINYTKARTKVDVTADVSAATGWSTIRELNYVITIYNDIRLYTNN